MRGLTLDGALDGIEFYLSPDFSALTKAQVKLFSPFKCMLARLLPCLYESRFDFGLTYFAVQLFEANPFACLHGDQKPFKSKIYFDIKSLSLLEH